MNNIEDYFSYNLDNGCIKASEKEPNKEDYMIELLNLDNSRLNKARLDAKNAFLTFLKSKNKQVIINKLLNSNIQQAFISYLRYYIKTSFGK